MRLPSHQGKSKLCASASWRESDDRRIRRVLGCGPVDAALSRRRLLALAARRPEMEIILGSRVNLMGRDVRRKAWRHYLGRVFATAVSLALDLPVYDTQCGAKVFRANDAVAAVFAAPFRSRWIFDVEVLARYLAQPAPDSSPSRRSRIYELAVPAWREVPGSRLRSFDYVRAMFDLLRIWRGRRKQAPRA
jgi:hypothetical protein